MKVSLFEGLERMKVICGRKEGLGRKVSVSRISHRDKRFGKSVCSVSLLTAKGCWVFENREFQANETLGMFYMLDVFAPSREEPKRKTSISGK